MRIIGDISTYAILQAEKTPEVGDFRAFNGKISVPVPDQSALVLDTSSYILPIDGGDVSSLASADMLISFPMYSQAVFNPLLSPGDIADLDLTAVFTPTGDITRAFVGRGAGPLPTGLMPGSVGVLGQNNKVGPARPGLLISDTIDIGPLTAAVGADEFMITWTLYDFDTSEDVTSSFGATAGLNDAAVRSIAEADPSPSGFEVWLSHDDGANYILMDRLTPTDFTTFGSLLRIAFRNTGSVKRRIACYSILF